MESYTIPPFDIELLTVHSYGLIVSIYLFVLCVAVLLTAARMLKERESELMGTIKLIFQPAEEGVSWILLLHASTAPRAVSLLSRLARPHRTRPLQSIPKTTPSLPS